MKGTVIRMKVTISDVAKRAGVSKTTVSRILNGNFDHTKEETKNRVLMAIKDFDYQPNALAKGLKSMKTNVIGMVLSNLKNPYWTTVLEGIEDVCHNSGYNLMICNSNENAEFEEQYIKEFQMRQVDGIVINPTARNISLYQKLLDSKYPMVVMNRRIPDFEANYVVMDNVKGAYVAVNHLLKNKKKKVAVFRYQNPHVSPWRDRVEGYRTALLENGFSKEDFRIEEFEQNVGKMKDAVIRHFKKYPDTDAVFSTNNMITLEVIEALKELNLKIPEDVAIVSYDETVWAKHLSPPLTTINQPGYQMGQTAAQILIRSIDGKNDPNLKLETVVFKPDIIVRKSCGFVQ